MTNACVFVHHGATAIEIQEVARAAATCATQMKMEERNGGMALLIELAAGKTVDMVRNLMRGGPLDILKFVAGKNIMVVGLPHHGYHA